MFFSTSRIMKSINKTGISRKLSRFHFFMVLTPLNIYFSTYYSLGHVKTFKTEIKKYFKNDKHQSQEIQIINKKIRSL